MEGSFIQFTLRVAIASTVLLNGIVFGSNIFSELITSSPVMTLGTSISFLLALALLDSTKKATKLFFYWGLALCQVINLLSLGSGHYSDSPYFLPSSLPTILFFSCLLIFRHLKKFHHFEARYFGFYAFFLMGVIPILGLFGNIIQGTSSIIFMESHPEVGLSFVTSLIGFATVILYSSKFKISDTLNIKAYVYSFEIFYMQLFLTLTLTASLKTFLSWNLHTSFGASFCFTVLLFYFISLKRIQKGEDSQIITICSIEKTIKPKGNDYQQWLSLEEFLTEKGYTISHGYSPETTKKIKIERIIKRIDGDQRKIG